MASYDEAKTLQSKLIGLIKRDDVPEEFIIEKLKNIKESDDESAFFMKNVIEIYDSDLKTLLMYACMHRCKIVANYLIDILSETESGKKSLEMADKRDWTALIFACAYKLESVANR